MSGLTGKGSLSIKKQEVAQSRLPAVSFRKVRALHKCTLGQTIINLTSLTAPSVSEAKNYSAPNPSLLASINAFEMQDNVTLKSSIRGELLQNVSFVVSGASTIELQFEAEENEILEITIDNVARTGATLVDARPLVVTGTLSAGQTDFNVGEPFKVGEFPLAQHGAVMVMVDNQPMYRNTNNQAPGSGVTGDYYEVHAGGGLGTIIRFNTPDLVNDRTVSVISIGSLVERPSGSLSALVESVQGQIDAMVPTLAALAGVSETVFQAQPNNIDLKAFGDKVFQIELDIDNLESTKENKKEGPGLKIGHNHTAGSATSLGANDLHFVKLVAPTDAVITRLSAFKAAQAAGIKSNMAIYSDASGFPSVKLGQTNEHTNVVPPTGSTYGGCTFYDLQAPVTLVKGQTYWLTYWTDTTSNMENFFSAPSTGLFVFKTITYSSVQPASVSAPFTTAGANPSLGGW